MDTGSDASVAEADRKSKQAVSKNVAVVRFSLLCAGRRHVGLKTQR